jgi:hypothetical protein
MEVLEITDMSVTNLLGLTPRLSKLEIRRNSIAHLVFQSQVLPPRACIIKLIRVVIYGFP